MSRKRLEEELEYRISKPLKAIELEYGVIGAVLPMLGYYMLYKDDYTSLFYTTLTMLGYFTVIYFLMAAGSVTAKRKELEEFIKLEELSNQMEESDISE